MADRWYANISSSMIKILGSPRNNFECYGCRSRKWRGCQFASWSSDTMSPYVRHTVATCVVIPEAGRKQCIRFLQ